MNTTYLRERRKAERISFAFPARASTGVMGEVVNFSRTGVRLALEKPLVSTRTMPIEIDFPFSSHLSSYVEIIWNRPDPENNRYLCGARFLRLKNNEEAVLSEAINRINTLNPSFVFLTDKMRDWLVDFKVKCDQFDLMYPQGVERIQFAEKNQLNLEMTLDTHFKNIWRCVENIVPEDYAVHLRYYWNMLGFYLVDLIEICRFVRSKPLGYAGDFMLMNYFYDYFDQYLGGSSYEMLINSYTCNIPIAYSVVERKEFFKQKILEILERKDSVRILSVASGSARELTELVEEGRINKPLYFDCLDVESEAFEYIKNTLQEIRSENKNNLHIRFLKEDFLDLVKGKDIHNLSEKYDFIYSSGLFDYLTDRMVKRLIVHLFGLLEDSASLVITNARKDDCHRAYYEMLGGWKLIHRSDKEVFDWQNEIKENCTAELVHLKTRKPFMFLMLALQKKSVNL
ncbi:MAG: PilZ domain-containing protein [Candidatus Omnitrophica bacterium]|nr:PilZ domain-containing protein [Candidatus Omnitrophota bacterium]